MLDHQAIEKMWQSFRRAPQDSAMFQTLEEHYMLKKNWERLSDIYLSRAKALEKDNAREAVHLYRKAGESFARRMGKADEALRAYKKCYQLDPDNGEYLEAMLDLCEGAQNWEEWLSILQEELDSCSSEEAKLPILYKMAMCCRDRLKNPTRAEKMLLAALEIDAHDAKTGQALEELYLSAHDYESLVAMYEFQVSHSRDPDLQRNRLQRAAKACEEQLRDPSRAIAYYHQLLELSPQDEPLHIHLENLHSAQGEWEKAVENMRRRLSFTGGEKRSELLARIADIWYNKLNQVEKAIGYYEEAWEAKQELRFLTSLEPLYRKIEDWKGLVRVYQRQLETATEDFRKKELYCQLAEIFERQLRQPKEAVKCYQRALSLAHDEDVLQRLQNLYEGEGQIEELLASYRLEITTTRDHHTKLRAYENMIRLLTEQGRHQDVANLCEEKLSLTPKDSKLYERLKKIYLQLESWEKLIAILRLEAEELLAPQDQVGNYQEVALLLKEKLGRESEAIECYHEILKIEPRHRRVLETLRKHYHEQGEFEKLVGIVQRVIEIDPEEALPGHLQIAQIYRAHLRSFSQAVKFYLKALDHSPHSLDARRELRELYRETEQADKFVEVTEELVALVPSQQEKVDLIWSLFEAHRAKKSADKMERCLRDVLELAPHHRRAIAELKKIYGQKQDFQSLVAILEREVGILSREPEALVQQYLTIAGYYEKLQQLPQAIFYYEKALFLEGENAQAIKRLEVLYTQQEAFDKLIHILEIKSKLASSASEKNNYLFMAGMLWEEQVEDKERAIDLYEQVVAGDPGHVNALDRLKKLYKSREQREKLEGVYRRLCESSSDPGFLIEVHTQAAQTGQDPLPHYRAIVRLDPKNREALDGLLKLYRTRQKWSELADIYKKKLAVTAEREELAQLYFELGNLYAQKLDHPYHALEWYHRVLATSPKNLMVLQAMEKICRDAELWPELAEVLQQKVKNVQNVEQKKALLLEIADICSSRIPQVDQAIQVYQELLVLDGSDVEVLASLKSLYRRMNEFGKVLQVLDKELSLASEEQQIELLFEKAELCESYLKQTGASIAALEKILEKAPKCLKACEKLAHIHRLRCDRDKLLNILERQCALVDEEAKQGLILEMAAIYRQQQQYDQAIECLQRCLEKKPDSQSARASLDLIYRKLGRWGDIIDLYESELQLGADSKRMVFLYTSLGQIWYEQLAKIDEALEMYHQVLELDANNLEVVRVLQQIYHRREEYKKLLDAYRQELKMPEIERERCIWLLLKCGELYEFQFQDFEAAQKCYTQVLREELDPKNLPAVMALQRINRAQGQHRELLKMLVRELELQPHPQQNYPLHLRIGQLKERVGDAAGALEYYRLVYEAMPEDLFVLSRMKELLRQQEAWTEYSEVVEQELLLSPQNAKKLPLHEDLLVIYDDKLNHPEKAISHAEAILDIDGEYMPAVLRLQKLYTQTGQRELLADMYLREAKSVPLGGARERLLHLYIEAGEIHLELQNRTKAVSCFRRAIEVDPLSKKALARLRDIYTAEKEWEDLIDIYQRRAAISQDPEQIQKLHFTMGNLWESELGDPQRAVVDYEIAYDRDPHDLETVQALRGIYEDIEKWPEALRFLAVEADLLEEDKRRAAVFFRMGEIWEDKLQHPTQALQSFLKVMQYGFHRPSAERIVRLQSRLENFSGLAEILEKVARHTQSTEERIDKLEQLGTIYRDKLEDPPQAIRTYMGILKLDPQHSAALDAMEELLPQVADWHSLIGVLTRKLKKAETGSEQFRLHCKIADVFYTHLLDGKKAISFYEKALELVDDDLDTIHTLQQIYEEWGYFESFIGLCRREIDLCEGKPEKEQRIVDLYRAIGDTWSQRLFKAARAIEAYESLLEILPEDIETIGKLARLYRQQRLWDRLVRVYPILIEEAQRAQDAQTEIGVQLDMGEVYHRYLGDSQSAMGCFQRVLELDPRNEKAFEAQGEIFQQLEQYEELAQLFEAKAQTLEDQNRLQVLWMHLGKLYEDHIEDYERAIERYNQALALTPDNFAILEALEKLYHICEKWRCLADVYQRKLELTEMPEEKAQLYYLLGRLHKDHFSDFEAARSFLHRAIENQDSHYASLITLAEISTHEEDWNQAAAYLLSALKYTEIPQEKVSLYSRLGQLYEKNLREIEKAEEVYRLALDINPHHFESLQALSLIYFYQAEFAKTEPLMGRLITLISRTDADKLADIYCKWGMVAVHLAAVDSAVSRFLKALELVPTHCQALFQLAELYFAEEQWEEALNAFNRAYDEEQDEEKRVEIIHRLAAVHEQLGDIDEAIRCYESLSPEFQNQAQALLSLSGLHFRAGNHMRALEYTKILAKGKYSEEEKAQAFKLISEVHLAARDFEKAIKSYLRAHELREDFAVEKKLVDLYMKVEDWQQACVWNDRCFEKLEQDRDKVNNRMLHARLKKSLNRNAEAIASYQKALMIDPTSVKAIKGIADIHLADNNWKELASSYELFLHELPPEKRQAGLPIHMALGYLYAEKLEDIPKAIKEFEKALVLDRENMGARVALAELKTISPEHEEEAIKVHLHVLRRDPYRVESYRDLYKLLRKYERRDQAFRAREALTLLDPDSEYDDSFTSVDMQKIDPFSEEDLLTIVPRRIRPYWELMNLTGEHMEKVYPSDIEGRFGLRRRDHLGAEGVQRPVWYYANNIMSILGINNLYMYIHDQDNYEVYLENTSPPSLLVSQKLVNTLSEAQMRFLLAKYLFYVAQKQYLAFKLPQTELHAYFRILHSSFSELKGAATQEMAVVYKRIRSALPRRMRKTLEAREDLWEAIANSDFGQYIKYLDYVGNRCALLLSNSLELGVSMIHFFKTRELVSVNRLSFEDLKSHEAIADLLLFNMSEPYGQLRELAGIAEAK